ncbi:Uncharacterised protein [Neisseria weaveri]|uniref:Uncharacterized protein n=1 Tax=Neisseria weaveri TaxID=28091 RepID=A0A3S4ZEN6_9NEIS|nr:hypothetical protein l13_20010 [Neisseria weaveri ATCC 51223]SAY50667.1 Uncharacterised protein [Neisseria weaveri]VEJ52079.1 Uncharacterised protein [Neisseria weaveri]
MKIQTAFVCRKLKRFFADIIYQEEILENNINQTDHKRPSEKYFQTALLIN